ncbi:hypothetical protein PA598K_01466 [Paenibacillus sp. 598K]|uniref:ORF6C domain-containing protein n=1 Tax=Paenibacillus sp. 598K TaxID=1117987 RepID=UPI000FFA7E42|nr:ORF6C domain-containing protein [Paenibacillus sp. 598K]GBF73181.1 hypothetical protein PA598K_01466 [Paenibacillus sp. 598K]
MQQLELLLDDKDSLLMRIAKLEAEVERKDLQITSYINRMTINKTERKAIRRQSKTKAVSILGEVGSQSYKKGYRPIFNQIYGDLKEKFNIGSIDDLLEIHFTAAIHFIDAWQPKEPVETPKECILCEEKTATLELDDGSYICCTCAQIMGELAP